MVNLVSENFPQEKKLALCKIIGATFVFFFFLRVTIFPVILNFMILQKFTFWNVSISKPPSLFDIFSKYTFSSIEFRAS